jgi:nucleotide-sensitive chloride channel 1A
MPVQQVTERESAEAPMLQEGEEVRLTARASCVMANDDGPGIVFISTQRLIWLSTADVTKGYAWTYSSIILHAVSRDPEAYAQQCIYCQLDGPTGDDDEDETPELRLVPENPAELDAMFRSMAECSALNPDPTDDQAADADSSDEIGEEVAAAMGWLPAPDPDAMEDAEEDEEGGDVDMEPELNGHK